MGAPAQPGGARLTWSKRRTSALCAVGAFGAVGLALAVWGGARAGVAGGILLVLAVAAPICARLRADPLDAVGIYGLATAAFLGLTSLTWLATPSEPAPGIDRGDIPGALVLVAASLAAFGLAAHLTGRARHVTPIRILPGMAPGLAALLVVFGFSFVATALGTALHLFGYSSDPAASNAPGASEGVHQLSGVGSIVVLVCAVAGFATNDRTLLRALLVLTPLQVLAGFAVGFKGASVAPIVYVGLAYVAMRGSVPWRRAIAVIVVASLVLIPANTIYRNILRPETSSPLTPAQAITGSYGVLSVRLRLIDSVAVIRARTPSVFPYGNGERYWLLPAVIAVPRILWPDKPVLDYGVEFSDTYWQIPLVARASTPPTQIGDLSRNFHSIGAVGGLAIWGLVVGGFTALRRRWRSPRLEVVYLASLVLWVWVVEEDLPELIAIMARAVPVAIVVAWLLMPSANGPPGYRRLLAAVGR